MVESGELESDFIHLYFFLPSITDWSEEINQYLKNDSVTPIDIKQIQLDTWAGDIQFDPSKLDTFSLDKKVMSETAVKCLHHINSISNSNIVRNADGLLSEKAFDEPVDWVGENK